MTQYARLVTPSKLRIRAPRVPIDLKVQSKTIGTSASYQFYTEDISRSGLLLVWDRDAKMPFNVNTLLEMTIDPEGNCLSKPVICLGKVVRRDIEKPEAAESYPGPTRLGVQIVQIDKTDLNAWEGCLSQLEKRFGIEVAGKIMGQ